MLALVLQAPGQRKDDDVITHARLNIQRSGGYDQNRMRVIFTCEPTRSTKCLARVEKKTLSEYIGLVHPDLFRLFTAFEGLSRWLP
jgi:hypothetical protein